MVTDAVGAGATGVDDREPFSDWHVQSLTTEEEGLDFARTSVEGGCHARFPYRHADWDDPVVADRRRGVARSLVLGERQPGERFLAELKLIAIPTRGHERDAALGDPAVHDRPHGLAVGG